MIAPLPGIAEKVAFLSRPEAYPDHVRRVETKQTHMSWVFLTESDAWKLKKPVRTEFLDFSTAELRRRNCESEVRLNRRLAADVYRGVVPLRMDNEGSLHLAGHGTPVDWLVSMRRLPAERMLDQVIARHAASEEELSKLASILTAFYKNAAPKPVTGPAYRARLTADLESTRRELTRTDHGLPVNMVESIIEARLEFVRRRPELFDARVKAGRIIEAHGDLRPEHICLEPQPVIIDCLEFNSDLRILDAASELAFLALECERLGATAIGAFIFKRYSAETGDRPDSALMAFYKAYHACIRARIAAWHLKDDDVVDRTHWIDKADRYLELASDPAA